MMSFQRKLSLALCILMAFSAYAQSTQKNVKHFGISMTLPEHWEDNTKGDEELVLDYNPKGVKGLSEASIHILNLPNDREIIARLRELPVQKVFELTIGSGLDGMKKPSFYKRKLNEREIDFVEFYVEDETIGMHEKYVILLFSYADSFFVGGLQVRDEHFKQVEDDFWTIMESMKFE